MTTYFCETLVVISSTREGERERGREGERERGREGERERGREGERERPLTPSICVTLVVLQSLEIH